MAKSNLPSVDKSSADWSQPESPIESVQKAVEIAIDSVGYVPRQIDVRMSRSQAEKFKAIQRKLEDAGATLKDGSPVNNRRRAVLWMIENHIGA